MSESKPMKWAELRERVKALAFAAKLRADVEGGSDLQFGLHRLLADIDTSAPAMAYQDRCAALWRHAPKVLDEWSLNLVRSSFDKVVKQ